MTDLHKDAIVIDGLIISNWSRAVFEDMKRGGLTAANCTCSVWDGFKGTMENIAQWKIWFEEHHREALREMRTLVDKSMDIMMENLSRDPKDIEMDEAIEIEVLINKKRDKFRSKNFKNIEKEKVSLDAGLIYMDLVSGYEKIADNVIHISQALRGDHLDLEDEVTT